MKNGTRAGSLLLLMALALIGGGCGGDGRSRSATNTFYYNEAEDVNSLDPARINARASWWVGNQIHAGLVTLDSSLTVQPQIARSWSISEDGRTWRFALREDVRFADDPCFEGGRGRRVTAEDVRYSFERICDPATASTGFWVFRGKVVGAEEFFEKRKGGDSAGAPHVAGFRAIDDTTFEIELVEPFAPMLTLLTIPYAYVVPREAVEKYGREFLRHPVGAGPFQLAEWRSGERMVLRRNPNYFLKDASGGQLPYLDSVSISFIKDKKSEFSEFASGRLDMIGSIDPTLLDRIFTQKGELTSEFARFGLHQSPSMSIEYYGFMLDSTTPGGSGSPFVSNRQLRQAMNYAIDREKLVGFVLRNQALPAVHGPIPPGTPGFTGVEGYRYDPARSRALLDSAGYPGGKGLPEVGLQISEGAKNRAVAEAIQEQLRAVGITVRLSQVAPQQHREMVATMKLPFWRANWMADYPDGENFLILFYSSYASPSGSNTTHFANRRVDSLYRAALDPHLSAEARATTYGAAERIIIDEAPWIFLFHSKVQRLTQPGITGYGVDPLDRLVLATVRKQTTTDS